MLIINTENGIRKSDHAQAKTSYNKFKGWSCNAGYQGIIIHEPDGSIKRSYSCDDAPLGNIETSFKLFNKAMPCITNSCVCSADSKIPKRRL